MDTTTLLSEVQETWNALEGFRCERNRNKRYTYGSQWDDRIMVDGQYIREEEYIRSQGSVPLKNNLIRRLVRNVLGVWRNEFSIPLPVARDPQEAPLARLMGCLLEANAQANRMTELYARTMEEFLISGVAIHRKSFSPLRGRYDCRTDYVHPSNFFFRSAGGDFRGWDLDLVGELHDIPLRRLIATMAGSAAEVKRIAGIYSLNPEDGAVLCRVIEVWREEMLPCVTYHDPTTGSVLTRPLEEGEEQTPGWSIKPVWKYYFLAPQGEILRSGFSPYSGAGHPYILKIYPFIDGEIHSFVGDVIDQQRYTNRLITLYDWIMRSSAKGVLLFPEGALPDGAEIDDIAEEWSRFNGVIMFRPKAGMPLPQQVSSNATNIGISELLTIQMKMFEDISGVNSALQGKLESSSVSGTLFSQQTMNALTSLKDIIESFREFVIEGTMADARNITRFYTPERIAKIAGRELTRQAFLSPLSLKDFISADVDFSFQKKPDSLYPE